jgi:hypothetical protein
MNYGAVRKKRKKKQIPVIMCEHTVIDPNQVRVMEVLSRVVKTDTKILLFPNPENQPKG